MLKVMAGICYRPGHDARVPVGRLLVLNGDGGSTLKVLLKYSFLFDHVGCTIS